MDGSKAQKRFWQNEITSFFRANVQILKIADAAREEQSGVIGA